MTPTPVSSVPATRGTSRRRATTLDRVRVREWAARLEEGEDAVEAFWQVASHPGYGLSKFRGATERPPEIVLRKKLSSLLERAAPELAEQARGEAIVRLSGLADDALLAVSEVVRGEFDDPQAARARLEGARTVLGSLGIHERAQTVAVAAAAAQGTMTFGEALMEMVAKRGAGRDVPRQSDVLATAPSTES